MSFGGAATSQPAETMQQGIGEIVDRGRNVADTGLDTVENIASGFTNGGRNFMDIATGHAANFVDQTTNIGSSGLGAGVNTIRNLQREGQRAAQQATGMTQGAVSMGENAIVGTLDRFAQAIAGVVPFPQNALGDFGNIVTDPFSVLNIAAQAATGAALDQ